MEFYSGTASDLQPSLVAGLGRYRHKVFVEKLGWKLQCENSLGLEYDQFDRDDTVYVVAQNSIQEIVGTARLLPTTQPYLLGEVFPQLLNGLRAPRSADIWELSRFAATDFSAPSSSALRQFSSPIAIDLLYASFKSASTRGAKRLITVSPPAVERLLRNAGITAHRAGSPMVIDGNPILAYWINL